MARRTILLVIDSLGIGEMPDTGKTRPQDAGANTLAHVVGVTGVALPWLTALGLGNIAPLPGIPPVRKPLGAFGKCFLAHAGADTYAGHQEIMGSRPLPAHTALFQDVKAEVAAALRRHGCRVEEPLPGRPVLLVDGGAVVADNLEADPGQIYNVTAALDVVPFEQALAIGRIVRAAVKVSRVIALGGRGITVHDLLARIEEGPGGMTGVNSPALGIYNASYRVRHMGYGINPAGQVATILQKAGQTVALIGKMADVIECDGAVSTPCVDTDQVLEWVWAYMREVREGMIAATVQETDLAGHQQDAARYGQLLQRVDSGIGGILTLLRPDDCLIITADHGNDPTIGHSRHTREMTPLLIAGRRIPPQDLGIRKTLADIGATVAAYQGVPAPQSGNDALAVPPLMARCFGD